MTRFFCNSRSLRLFALRGGQITTCKSQKTMTITLQSDWTVFAFFWIALKPRQTLLWSSFTVALVIRRRQLSDAKNVMQNIIHELFEMTTVLAILAIYSFWGTLALLIQNRRSTNLNSLNQYLTIAIEREKSLNSPPAISIILRFCFFNVSKIRGDTHFHTRSKPNYESESA